MLPIQNLMEVLDETFPTTELHQPLYASHPRAIPKSTMPKLTLNVHAVVYRPRFFRTKRPQPKRPTTSAPQHLFV
jgi:hypothetical protein